MTGLVWKFARLITAIRIFRNWQDVLSIYFGRNNAEYAILETRSGIKMKIRPKSTDIHVVAEIFLLKQYHTHSLQPGSIIIDVGGHIGLFSVFVATLLRRNCKIYVFEPIEQNYSLLRENIKLNGLEDVILTENIAVFGSTGKTILYLHNDMAAHSILEPTNEQIEINTISLKDIFDRNNVDRCDYLKMDCEGAEYEIFSNLPDEYLNRISVLKLEYHHVKLSRNPIEQLKHRLASLGFSLSDEIKSENQGLLFALNSQSNAS